MKPKHTNRCPISGLPLLESFVAATAGELAADNSVHDAFLADDIAALEGFVVSEAKPVALFAGAALELCLSGEELAKGISLLHYAADSGSRLAWRVLGDSARNDSFMITKRNPREAWEYYYQAARLGDPGSLDRLCEIAWGDYPDFSMPFSTDNLRHHLRLARDAATPAGELFAEMVAAAAASGRDILVEPFCFEPAGMADCLIFGHFEQLYDCLFSGGFLEAAIQLAEISLERLEHAGEEGDGSIDSELATLMEQPALRHLVPHQLGEALMERVLSHSDQRAAVLLLLLHLGGSFVIDNDEFITRLQQLAAGTVTLGPRGQSLLAMLLRISSWRRESGVDVELLVCQIDAAGHPTAEIMFLCAEALNWACKHLQELGGEPVEIERLARQAHGFSLREIASLEADGCDSGYTYGRACLGAASSLVWQAASSSVPLEDEPALYKRAIELAEKALVFDDLVDACCSTLLAGGGNQLWRAVGHQAAQELLLKMVERLRACEFNHGPESVGRSLLAEVFICLSQINTASSERLANLQAPANAREAIGLLEARGVTKLLPIAYYALWNCLVRLEGQRTAESDAAIKNAAAYGDRSAQALVIPLRINDGELTISEAIAELQPLADSGESTAMTILGEIYSEPDAGEHFDLASGEELLRQAAQKGDTRAVYLAGMSDAAAGKRTAAESAAARLCAWGHADPADEILAALARAPRRGVVLDFNSRLRPKD